VSNSKRAIIEHWLFGWLYALEYTIMAVRGQQVERADLDMLYDMVASYPLRAVARYVGLDSEFIQSLTQTQHDQQMYQNLTELVELTASQSPNYNLLVQAILGAYLGVEGWQSKLEAVFEAYLNELRAWVTVDTPQSLMAIIFRDLEEVRLSFKDALILESRGGILPSTEEEVNRLLEKVDSPERYRRLLEVAVLSLTIDLVDDLNTIVTKLSTKERDAEYYSYSRGRGDSLARLGERIDRDRAFEETVTSPADRLIYTLKRGGWRTPELRQPIRAVGTKPLTNEAIRKRFERINRRLSKK
jgi:hypothetical protein